MPSLSSGEPIFATFAGLSTWFEVLERIDKTLVTNSSNLFHELTGTRVTAARLYMRALGAYRAAARLAVSGQLYETAVLRRSIVEHAIYAWACGHSQSHRDTWVARANGEPERKAARKAFQWNSLMQLLGTVDQKLATELANHYDDSINFGAHPNVEGVDLSSQVVKSEEKLVWTAHVSEVAKRLGVSDVGLTKLCRRAAIPIPPRGYWARVESGQWTGRTSLPPAPEGLPALLRIRGRKSAQAKVRLEAA